MVRRRRSEGKRTHCALPDSDNKSVVWATAVPGFQLWTIKEIAQGHQMTVHHVSRSAALPLVLTLCPCSPAATPSPIAIPTSGLPSRNLQTNCKIHLRTQAVQSIKHNKAVAHWERQSVSHALTPLTRSVSYPPRLVHSQVVCKCSARIVKRQTM